MHDGGIWLIVLFLFFFNNDDWQLCICYYKYNSGKIDAETGNVHTRALTLFLSKHSKDLYYVDTFGIN